MEPDRKTLALRCPKCASVGSMTISTTGIAYVPELYVSATTGRFDAAVTQMGTPIATCLKCMITADADFQGETVRLERR